MLITRHSVAIDTLSFLAWQDLHKNVPYWLTPVDALAMSLDLLKQLMHTEVQAQSTINTCSLRACHTVTKLFGYRFIF